MNKTDADAKNTAIVKVVGNVFKGSINFIKQTDGTFIKRTVTNGIVTEKKVSLK